MCGDIFNNNRSGHDLQSTPERCQMFINSRVSYFNSDIKGGCSEICGKFIFVKLADVVTFPTNISPKALKEKANMFFLLAT